MKNSITVSQHQSPAGFLFPKRKIYAKILLDDWIDYIPSGNQLVLFSLETWCFPRLRLGKHQDSRENKTNCFPRDLTLSVYYWSVESLSTTVALMLPGPP